MKYKRIFKNKILLASFIILLALVIKLLVFEIFIIPSESMDPSLIPGDVVLMNKANYGCRFAKAGKTVRLPGYSSPQRSDVVIFNIPIGDSVMSKYPMEDYYEMLRVKGRQEVLNRPEAFGQLTTYALKERTVYIKRVIGMPGDTVFMCKDSIYINREIWSNRSSSSCLVSFKLQNKSPKPKPDSLDENLSWYKYIFPHSPSYNWNIDTWGPLYVPGKGDVIFLTIDNLPIYHRLITAYEGNNLDVKNRRILVNGHPTEKYTVNQNYYLVMGDNSFFSHDSRFWGFLPEDHIIGKASMVLLSYNKGDLIWNRFFKPL